MNKQINKKLLWEIIAVLAFITSIIISLWVIYIASSESDLTLSMQNANASLIIFTISFLSFMAVVAAPTSTTFIIYALITVWDWRLILIGSTIGGFIGHAVAFKISERLKERIYSVLPWLKKFARWQSKLDEADKLVHLFFLRLATIYVGDYISYIAGLTKVSFKQFMLATFFADLLFSTVFYYLIDSGLDNQQYIFVALLFTFSSLSLWGVYIIYSRRQKLPN